MFLTPGWAGSPNSRAAELTLSISVPVSTHSVPVCQPFHSGRVEDFLPHEVGVQGGVDDVPAGRAKGSGQAGHASDDFRRTLDLGVTGVFGAEEVGQEDSPHGGTHVAAGSAQVFRDDLGGCFVRLV